MKYYFISTDHLRGRIWFRDEDDFRAAMNYVAIVAWLTGVRILAFVLLSNHVHFVLSCDDEFHARAFIDRFKLKYGLYYWRRYGVKEYLRENSVNIQEVYPRGESLERAIAYVQMNPVAAGISQHAFLYPWGTGNVFFNLDIPKGTPLLNLSKREQYARLHCKDLLPGHYQLDDSGCVLPFSYVCRSFVESLFRSSKRYNYFLVTSSKAKARLDKDATPVFQDKSMLAVADDLCTSLFGKRSIGELSETHFIELLHQLRVRFGTSLEQLVRITGRSYQELSEKLDAL